MDIRAVIFDRDNTLMRFDPNAIAALEEQITEIAPSLPPTAAVEHWTAWPGPWPHSVEEEPAFWENFWGSLAARYGLSAATAAALQRIGPFYHTCFVAFPETVHTLRTLRAAGLQLAVLTNFQLPSVHDTLHYAGIDPAWFAALLSSSAIGVRKPDARAYTAVTSALGLPPQACAFVDDLPANVVAARMLGMRAWLIDRAHPPQPDAPAPLVSLYDLVELLTVR
jgi:FMN phosphatase YigB (HAD superfamily)